MSLYKFLLYISLLTPLLIFADYYKGRNLVTGIIYVSVFYSTLFIVLPVLIDRFAYEVVFFVPAAVAVYVLIAKKR
jgi:hypothetical protein